MKELYDNLFKSGDYTKSFEKFVDQFGDTEKSKVLYNALNEAGDYTKSFEEFVVQFGFGEKKKTNDTSTSTLETEDMVSTTEEDPTDGSLDSSEVTETSIPQVTTPEVEDDYEYLKDDLLKLEEIETASTQTYTPGASARARAMREKNREVDPILKSKLLSDHNISSALEFNVIDDRTLDAALKGNKNALKTIQSLSRKRKEEYLQEIQEKKLDKENAYEESSNLNAYEVTEDDKTKKDQAVKKVNDFNKETERLLSQIENPTEEQLAEIFQRDGAPTEEEFELAEDSLTPTGFEDSDLDDMYDSQKLKNIKGFNAKDFDGYLSEMGYVEKYQQLLDDEVVSEDGRFYDISGNYNPTLAAERLKFQYLSNYINDKVERKVESQILKYQAENEGRHPSFDGVKIDFSTGLDDKAISSYVEEQFPTLTAYLKDRDRENQKNYQEYLNGENPWVNQSVKQGWRSVEDRISSFSEGVYEFIGMSNTADEIRMSAAQTELERDDFMRYTYASGKKATIDGREYGIDERGQIYDLQIKKNVTQVLTEDQEKSIRKKVEGSDETFKSFSSAGAVIATSGIASDMVLQIALTRGAANLGAGGSAFLGAFDKGSKVLNVLNKIPMKANTASAMIAQGTLFATNMSSDAYKKAIENGVDQDTAEEIRHLASAQGYALGALTAPISTQITAMNKIFGEQGSKKISESVVRIYQESGKKGVNAYFQKVRQNIIQNYPVYFRESGKEMFQENVQQAGQAFIIADNVNELAGKEIMMNTITGAEYTNTTILAGMAGLLMPFGGDLTSATGSSLKASFRPGEAAIDRMEALHALSRNPKKTKELLDGMVKKGVYSQEQVDNIISDIDVYSKNIGRIPPNLTPETSLKVMGSLEKINQLEEQKKNLDESFHADIDKKIEDVRSQVRKDTEFDYVNIKGKTKLKEEAGKQLTKEAEERGEKDFTINDSAITDRAIDNFSKMTLEEKLSYTDIEQEVIEMTQDVEEEIQVTPEEEAEVETKKFRDDQVVLKEETFTITDEDGAKSVITVKTNLDGSLRKAEVKNFDEDGNSIRGEFYSIADNDIVLRDGLTAEDILTKRLFEGEVLEKTSERSGNEINNPKKTAQLTTDQKQKLGIEEEAEVETTQKVEPLKTTKPNKKLKDAFDNETISEEDLESMTLYALNKKQNKKRLTPFEKRLLEATSVERGDQIADLQIKLEDNIEAQRAEVDDIRAQKIKESEVEIKTEPATVEGAPDGTYLNVGMIEGKGGRELTEEEIESALPDGVEVLEKTRLEKGENVDEPTLSIKTSRPLTDAEMKAFREATGQLAIPQIVDGVGTMFGTTDWGPFNAEFFVMPDKAKLSDIAKPTAIDESEQSQTEKDPKKSLEKTKKDFEQSEQALKDRVKKPTFKERLRLLREKIFDRQTRVKDLLKGVGNKKATKAKNLLVTKAGATGFANFRFKKADEKIYKGLKDQDLKTLDHIIYLRRLKAINENRKAQGKEPYVGVNDTDYDTAVAALKGYEEELGDKKYKDFESRADKYFEAMNESLTRMKDSGLISEEVFNQLKDIDYSPIKTLDYIIPDTADAAEIDRMAEISGIKADVIKTLSDKNLKDIIMDTRWLLSSNLGMIEAKVFENKMLNAFSEAVESAEGDVKTEIENYVLPNPVIGKTKEGKPKRKYDKKTPPGFTKVHFKKDGVDNYMVIDNAYATQLLDIKTKSRSSINLGNVGKLTGTNILRFFATSGNPLFIVGNTAVDFANILFLSDVYSNNKFKGGAELAFDFVKTFGSKVGGTKEYKKIYEEFMEHGGAMDYLSTDGLKAIEGFRGKNKVFNTASKAMKSWGDFMSYLGETSEVSFRVAVYSKVKNNLLEEFKKENGRDPSKEEMEDIMFEAVREARETIDFSQGGSIVKAADKALPYLNAGTQGLRKGVDYAAKNPKGFASSILQAMIMAGGASAASIFMLLRSFDEDEDPKKVLDVLNSISDYEKSNYHILFTGEKDENGEHRYIRVKKLPTIGIASTIAEQLTIKAILKSRGIDYDLNDKALRKSASGISPIDVSQGLPGLINRNPLAAASLTYAYNYDHFYGQDVFKGPRNKKILPSAEGLLDDRVDQVYKDLGQAFGFSPKRSKAAVEKIITSETTNPSIGLIYSGYDKLRGLVGEAPTNNEIESVVSKMVKNAEKKLVRSTNKKLLSYKDQDDVKEMETKIETGIYLKEQQAYNDIRKRYENNDPFTSEEFKQYILGNFPKIDAKKYAKKYVAYIKNMNGDKSILDIVFEDTPEVQAYRIYKKFGDSFDEDEKKEIGKVFKAAKRKFSKKALYIYNQKYRKK